MGPDEPHGDWRQGGAEPYWRRRILVLGGVLGLVGLVAWGCSSAVPVSAPPGQAAATAASDAAQQAASSTTPTPVHPATVKTRTANTRRTHRKRAATRAHPLSNACAPGDLVISLAESRRSYPQPAEPRFTIYAVNTGGQTCTLDAGPRSLRLVVESGSVRAWSPADCAHGSISDMARLARGMPLVKQISWNRIRSMPGCPLPRVDALPGTYTATVTDGSVHSQTVVFLLR